MYEYSICTQANEEIFYKQCAALEKHIGQLEKEELLQDVDSTLIQTYKYFGKKITVYNDLQIGCVRIKSEIDIDQFFNN